LDGESDGGTAIIDYRMNLRIVGASEYTIATSGILDKYYTVTDLALGTNYEFVVEARNEVGYSPISDSVSLLHAIAPEQPVAPTTLTSG
jgi:hypothetical protein